MRKCLLQFINSQVSIGCLKSSASFTGTVAGTGRIIEGCAGLPSSGIGFIAAGKYHSLFGCSKRKAGYH